MWEKELSWSAVAPLAHATTCCAVTNASPNQSKGIGLGLGHLVRAAWRVAC